MAIVTLFKNRYGPVNVSTPKGKVLKFAAGRYFTTDKTDMEYLKELAETGQSGVFIDKSEPEVDTENLDPMAAIKAKMRAEIEADIKAGRHNMAAPNASGNYEQKALQNSTQNTMGTAAPSGTPVAKAQETVAAAEAVKVSGNATEAEETTKAAPPSKLEEMKKGSK
jgi:hypothetical protein